MGRKSRQRKSAAAADVESAAALPSSPSFSNPYVIAGALALCTLVVFWKTTSFTFIPYDDNEYIYTNEIVSQGLTGEGIAWAFEGAHFSNWHPLTWISHMIDVTLFGLNAGAHHRTGILLHALATALLFLALLRMTNALWRSAAVAALFAIHPLHVESVAWVAERKDVLSGVFFAATLLAWIRYVRQPGTLRYVIVCAAFVLGLLSKQMLVTLPFVLLLLDWWPLGRGVRVVEKLPLFALSAIASAVTFLAQRAGAVASIESLPLQVRLANAIVSYGRYLRKTFWPADLALLYPMNQHIDPVMIALCAVLVTAVTAVAWWRRRTEPYLLTGWLWYLGMLVPVIGIVQVGTQSHADRYTYLPLIGIFIAVVWLAASLPVPREASAGAAAAVLLVLAFVTSRQLEHWRDGVAVFSHTLAITRDNGEAEGALAIALRDAGRDAEAIPHLREAVRLLPNELGAWVTLGNLLAAGGDANGAIAAWQRALALDPNQADVQSNMGVAYSQLGKLEEARAAFRRAVEIDPSFAPAQEGLKRLYP